LEKGLLPEFSGDALAELDKIITPATIDDEKFRDLRNLYGLQLIMMIQRDLDQLTVPK